MNHVAIAFLVTLIAGLFTSVGSCLSFLIKRTNTKLLSLLLGFAAGVMIYLSMMEILIEGMDTLSTIYGTKQGIFYGILSFVGGMAIIALINKIIPHNENHHIGGENTKTNDNLEGRQKLMRTGMVTAVAITIHNFPEGLAVFMSVLQDPKLAISTAFGIALHNVPVGIAISAPIYYATGNKKKAFMYSFVSGLSAPLGGVVGYLLLMPIMNDTIVGILFGIVAGIMVFVSLDELLPAAREYEETRTSIFGLIIGMFVMAIILLCF